MGARYTSEVASTLEALPVATGELSAWLEAHDADAAAAYLATLALEELVTNCIKYGYDDEDEHVIRFRLELTGTEMIMVVEDDGHPFNPLEQAEPDTDVPAQQRQIGGLGIHLLRKMSDKMEYVWENNVNRITLRKSLVR